MRSLADRGLRGTRLIIANDHKGLKAAAAKVLGATVQRCRVHFMRNALACVGKKDKPIVTAALRTAFDQDTLTASKEHWAKLIDAFRLGFIGFLFTFLTLGVIGGDAVKATDDARMGALVVVVARVLVPVTESGVSVVGRRTDKSICGRSHRDLGARRDRPLTSSGRKEVRRGYRTGPPSG